MSSPRGGIFRMAMENVLYSPPLEKTKKKTFSDEALNGAKKVSRLVEKFECGDLDMTVESTGEVGVPCRTPEASECENAEGLADGHAVEGRETPRRQFSFADSEVFETVMEADRRSSTPIDEKCYNLVETPILRSVARRISGDAFTHCRESGRNLFRNDDCTIIKEYAVLSPIKKEPRNAVHSVAVSAGRELKTIPEPRKEEECSSESSVSPSSRKGGFSSGNESEGTNDFAYSKMARAQVHDKIEKFHSWKAGTLHAIAEPLSKMRISALKEIQNPDARVHILLKLYTVCTTEMNREIDSTCAALGMLIDNPTEERLSIHEEYIAAKYERYGKRKTTSAARH